MKKHDEGYTLPFVLVILTILYFVVSIVLTSAETTVTAQQQSIAQMKQKYAAQGKIEMLVGQLCDETIFQNIVLQATDKEDAIKDLCSASGVEMTDRQPLTQGDESLEFIFEIASEQGTVRIVSEVKLTCNYNKYEVKDETTGETTEKITITDLHTEYLSYDIGTVGGDAA